LEDVSFDLPAATNLAVIGPSGSGKSTLLHLIAGLIEPTEGEIHQRTEAERGKHFLSLVFQKDTLLPWLTVEKNVALYSKFGRHDKKGVKSRVAELLALGGLEKAAHKYPYQLSGGMRRRAQVLAAVAPSPRLLLLDEPFSSLDEPTRVRLHQEVFDIAALMEMSIVLVTHDLAEAISMSDEVLILSANPGKVFSRYPVPFGRPRSMSQLRESPDFLRLYQQLWHDLQTQINRAGGEPQ
jgi:NitT/TauT family transport system ATP-binding protein